MSELQKAASASASLGLRPSPTFGAQLGRVRSVLVVGDERGARDSLRLTLEPHFRARTANLGEAAFGILERGLVSVMTLELPMPGWGGPETLLKITGRALI